MGLGPRRVARYWISTAIGLIAVACARSTPDPAAGPPAPSPAPTAQPVCVGPRPTVSNDDAGNCEPLPKEGESCGEGDSWCIVDWGEPGGHSTAMWCRDGRWEVESEVNLPADDGMD